MTDICDWLEPSEGALLIRCAKSLTGAPDVLLDNANARRHGYEVAGILDLIPAARYARIDAAAVRAEHMRRLLCQKEKQECGWIT